MEASREVKLRSLYERASEYSQNDSNSNAVTKFIDLLKVCEKSQNANVRDIAENIEGLSILKENFMIFESPQTSSYIPMFTTLSLCQNDDDLKIFHEFARALLHITSTQANEEFTETIKRAKMLCSMDNLRDIFTDYVIYLSDDKNEARTKWEKGPVSEIISSVFQYPSIRFKNRDNKKCILPSYQSRDYFFDEESQEIKIEVVFEENFANFFTLVANNCVKELEILKMLFGQRWFQTMSDSIEASATVLKVQNQIEREEGNILPKAI